MTDGFDQRPSAIWRLAAILALALGICALAAASAFGDDDDDDDDDPAPPPAPLVSGEPSAGAVLVASSSDPGSQPNSFRWQRCVPGPAACDGLGGPADSEWANIAGASGPSASSYTLTDSDVGRYVRVLVSYPGSGSQLAASVPFGPIEPARGQASAPAPAPLVGGAVPPPIVRETANIDPLSGTTFVREPTDPSFRLVTEPEQILLGSVVDVRNGHADVTTERNADSGILQTAEFWSGTYRITQGAGNRPVTRLKLVGDVGGPFGGRARGENGGRQLWGRGRCRCRTRGRFSSGTVRGTWWLTVDRADSTLTKVKQGAVKVLNFRSGEKELVEAGETYVARARGAGRAEVSPG